MNKLYVLLFLLVFSSCSVFKPTPKVECPESVKDYDGNSYSVIRIGNQCWMASNLKAAHYSDGSEIDEKYVYNDDESKLETYGMLYSWNAAMNGAAESNKIPSEVQGACPKGWHIPSDAEWSLLEKRMGVPNAHLKRQGWDLSNAGGRLKNDGQEYWKAPNKGATNDRGFNALPAGSRQVSGVYTGLGTNSFFWSSSMLFGLTSWGRGMSYSHEGIYRFNDDPGSAFSVRCIKD